MLPWVKTLWPFFLGCEKGSMRYITVTSKLTVDLKHWGYQINDNPTLFVHKIGVNYQTENQNWETLTCLLWHLVILVVLLFGWRDCGRKFMFFYVIGLRYEWKVFVKTSHNSWNTSGSSSAKFQGGTVFNSLVSQRNLYTSGIKITLSGYT